MILYCISSESDVKINKRRGGRRGVWHLETVWAAVTLGMSPAGPAASSVTGAESQETA